MTKKNTFRLISVLMVLLLIVVLTVGQTTYAISNSDLFIYGKSFVEAGSDVKIESSVAKIYKSDKGTYTVIVDPSVQKSAVASYLDDMKADLEDMETAINYAAGAKAPVMQILGTLWNMRANWPSTYNTVTSFTSDWSDAVVASLMADAKAKMIADIRAKWSGLPDEDDVVAEASALFDSGAVGISSGVKAVFSNNANSTTVGDALNPAYSSLQKNINALEVIAAYMTDDYDALVYRFDEILASKSGIKLVSTTTIEGVSASVSKELTYQDILDGSYDLGPVTLQLPASLFPANGEKIVDAVSELSIVTTAPASPSLKLVESYSVSNADLIVNSLGTFSTVYTAEILSGTYDTYRATIDVKAYTWDKLAAFEASLATAYNAQRSGGVKTYDYNIDMTVTAPDNINEVVNTVTKTITLVAQGTPPGPVNKYNPDNHTTVPVNEENSSSHWDSEDGSRTKITSKYNEDHQTQIRKNNKVVDATVRCNQHGNEYEFEIFVGDDSVSVLGYSNGNSIVVNVTDDVSFIIRWQTNDGMYHYYLIDGAGEYTIPNGANIVDMWVGLGPEKEIPVDPPIVDPDPDPDPDPKDPDPDPKKPEEKKVVDKDPIVDKTPSDLPYTGVENTNGVWIAVTAAGLTASGILVFMYRKRKLV